MALSDLRQIKCKTCGEPLDISKASGRVVKCEVCNALYTLPKADASQKLTDYLFQAEGDLDTGRFEEAYAKYAKASELDETEPEAYLGMALAEGGIRYVKDGVNNRLQPICYRTDGGSFSGGANFLKAMRCATEEQRAEYAKRAEEIDRIKREFLKLKLRGVDYDCFICVKVTDEKGEKTADADFAHRLYRMLKNNSYSPFYSEAVLKDETGADYEAHILYALASSETMLVVCFDGAYLRTKWVQNEYSRFLKLMNDEEKESDAITVVYRGTPIEKLPGKKGKIQGVDADDLDCPHRVLQFVERHTPEARRRREEIAVSQATDAEDLRKKLAEQEERFRQLEAMLLKAQRAQTEQPRPQAQPPRPQRTEQPVPPRPAVTAEGAPAPTERRTASPSEFEISGGVIKKFKGASRSAVIPARAVEIGNYAFNNCNIESAEIHGGVARIGNYAFNNCSSLEELTLGEGVREIDNYAFNNCTSLKKVFFSDSVTEISSYAFNNCSSLEEVRIGKGVRRVGSRAFNNCTSLRSVTLPARLRDSLGKIFGADARCKFIFID